MLATLARRLARRAVRATRPVVLVAAVLALPLALHGAAPPRQAMHAGRDAPGSTVAADTGRRRVLVRGVDLTDVGYDLGDPAAPVVVVEFSDFGCAYCAQFALRTGPRLEREFVDSGHVRWKVVPFLAGGFRHGAAAAAAAECAGEQGRFAEARAALFGAQRAWGGVADPDPVLGRLMADAGVERRRFAGCYARRARADRTARATAAAAQMGVRATPSFFVESQLLEGAVPLAVFRGGLRRLLRERAPGRPDDRPASFRLPRSETFR